MKVKYNVKEADKASINWGGHSNPNGVLEFGKEYELETAEVRSSYTKIFLKDFPDQSFNSVWFTWSETDDIWELDGATESWQLRCDIKLS